MTKLVAYHNDRALKASLVTSLTAHAKADAIVKGKYWEAGKGCAVGCTLQSLGNKNRSDHMAYEKLLGIPVMLARLEDRIFEGLPNDQARGWPLKFTKAIKPGADLSLIGWKFLHWLLTDSGILEDSGIEQVKIAIERCAQVLLPLTKGLPIDKSAAYAAAAAAYAAADAAADATADATAYDASAAADAAARSASAAAYDAAAAAYDAADAAASAAADAAESAWSGADAYENMANKLLTLLWAAK